MSIQSNFPNLKPTLLLDFANTKQLDSRVTFTRSTPAVYYDGKTAAVAEENLFLSSQDFQTANGWANQEAAQTLTLNSIVAPDGTTTADTLIEPPSGSGTPRCYQIKTVTANTAYTISCYLKANTRTFAYVQLEILGVGNVIQYFNLSTGAASTLTTTGSSSNVSNTITSAGNGWYRCTLTATFPSGTSMYAFIGLANSTPAQFYTCNGSSIYAWGAQLEQRSSATAYTPTTTQPITNYIPVLLTAGGNQPRFDCNPTTGESLGLLIEEARTNVLSYSSDLSNAYWDKFQLNLTSNTIIAPDGTLTGDKLASNTVNTSHYSYPASGIAVSAGIYTASIYAKAGERSRLIAGIWAGSDYAMAQFDLANGTIVQEATAGMASITPVGNGWYRCTVNRTIGAVTTYFSFGPYINGTFGPLTGAFPQYADDGFSGIYVWGAQLEASSFATSYIATTSASATRTADSASMTGTNFSSWYNNAEWTLYTEAAWTNITDGAAVSIDDNSFNAVARVTVYETGLAPSIYSNNAFQFNVNTQLPTIRDQFYKTSFAAKPNNFAAITNTNAIEIDNSGVLFNSSPFQMLIGRSFYGSLFTGRIKKIAYYPIRVTNAQLQALTS